MHVVWAASVPIWMTFTGMFSPSEGCTWGANDETRWREFDGALSYSLRPTAASWASVKVPAVRSLRIVMMPLGNDIFRTR
jgi:hypothetical protein